MKWFIAATLAGIVPGVSGCRIATPPTFADKFDDVENLMARDELTQLLGPTAKVRSETFPTTPFMGPGEAMSGILRPGQAHEVWEYVDSGEVYLVYIAGASDDAPEHQWTVVGKTHYPQGAVF